MVTETLDGIATDDAAALLSSHKTEDFLKFCAWVDLRRQEGTSLWWRDPAAEMRRGRSSIFVYSTIHRLYLEISSDDELRIRLASFLRLQKGTLEVIAGEVNRENRRNALIIVLDLLDADGKAPPAKVKTLLRSKGLLASLKVKRPRTRRMRAGTPKQRLSIRTEQGEANMWQYRIIAGDPRQVESELNELAAQGWEPAFYSVAGTGGVASHFMIVRRAHPAP
jgi:hypothetical protein